jgi:hypothetical protein
MFKTHHTQHNTTQHTTRGTNMSMSVPINPAEWVTGELLWRWPIKERDKILVGFLHGMGIETQLV